MRKLNLTDWASISEIVGTLAVVVSLILVVLSIDRNTAAVQVANENFLYELTDSNLESIVNDPGLVAIYVKYGRGDELSEIEKYRADVQTTRLMNRWNLAFDRHKDGMFEAEKWEMWNESYETSVDIQYLREWWVESKSGYGVEFSTHIESIISDN